MTETKLLLDGILVSYLERNLQSPRETCKSAARPFSLWACGAHFCEIPKDWASGRRTDGQRCTRTKGSRSVTPPPLGHCRLVGPCGPHLSNCEAEASSEAPQPGTSWGPGKGGEGLDPLHHYPCGFHIPSHPL